MRTRSFLPPVDVLLCITLPWYSGEYVCVVNRYPIMHLLTIDSNTAVPRSSRLLRVFTRHTAVIIHTARRLLLHPMADVLNV